MIALEHPDALFVKGCRYVALKSFNGGMPTHDFIENEIYIYLGSSYERYDSAYSLCFKLEATGEVSLWFWWSDSDFAELATRYFKAL